MLESRSSAFTRRRESHINRARASYAGHLLCSTRLHPTAVTYRVASGDDAEYQTPSNGWRPCRVPAGSPRQWHARPIVRTPMNSPPSRIPQVGSARARHNRYRFCVKINQPEQQLFIDHRKNGWGLRRASRYAEAEAFSITVNGAGDTRAASPPRPKSGTAGDSAFVAQCFCWEQEIVPVGDSAQEVELIKSRRKPGNFAATP